MKLQTATFGTALLMGALVATAPNTGAQEPRYSPVLPEGTYWDFVISGGAQKGIAFLTFDQGTFSGYQLLSAWPKATTTSTSSGDLRGPFVDVGRGLTATVAPDKTNVFGFSPVSGQWAYDERWRVVGSYSLTVGNGTNAYIYPVSFLGRSSVNQSLTGVVRGSLTMVASTPNGRITYSGRPHIPQSVDLTGNWQAFKKVKGVSFAEFFPLEPAPDEAGFGFADIYQVGTGARGPGYDITDGMAMLSSQRKIGFAFRALADNPDPTSTNMVYTLYSSFGSFAKSRAGYKASTSGIQEPSERISFNAFFVPTAPLQ